MIKNFLPNRQPTLHLPLVLKSMLEVASKKINFASPSLQKEDFKVTKPRVSILGCRGIPAKYGGFETFAERLSLYLTSIGWDVTVYCQDFSSHNHKIFQKTWQGIRLVHIPVSGDSALSSIIFDWKCILHAVKEKNIVLTLGYNTALFCFLFRLKGMVNIINMDGLEWCRQKWKLHEKVWLYINERLGCWFGNHLIADHPEIKSHLMTRVPSEKITIIPYGWDEVTEADATLLERYNLKPNGYAIVIARPEPENNILEIVSAFSSKPRGIKLVVLGRYLTDTFLYHKQVIEAASDEVIFPGAIYEPSITKALRFYTRLYIHGHTVGGTNPSLVEALAAGSPVLAHNNRFNCWVAGSETHYFTDQQECENKLDQILHDTDELQRMRRVSFNRYKEEFSDQIDLKLYASLLQKYASFIV